MIPRDYRSTGKALADNINATIRQHPDKFECLLYRADLSAPETVASSNDVVGSMETSERAVTYLDPIPAIALRVIAESFFLEAANTGDTPDGNIEQPYVLMLAPVDPAEPDHVPEQSIIQFEEMINDTDRRLISIYVVRNDLVGSAPGGKTRQYCIPFQGFDAETL